MGAGDSREARLADAAAAFVGGALAPLLSRLKGDAVLEARAFWGDEPWAVPGVRGFASAVVARGGADGARFAQAPLFSGIPELPQDGKVHLLKAVVASSGDAWLRTIELDGGATSVSDSRFAALDAQDAPGMVPPAQDARARALERLRSREAWLTSTEACPADLMPATMPDFAYSSGACRGGRLLECLALCEKRAASFCCAAAQEVLQAKEDPGGAQALLLRSCELGFASGCTNAAAGRLGQTSEMDGCSERTFERTCERASDPWACTMHGAALVRSGAAKRDAVRARAALDKACRGNQDDAACRAADALSKDLEDAE